jgi:multisubunit Na+/H+ antiporter MnhB subunit
MVSKPKLILISVVCGIVLTFFLTAFAFEGNSRAWTCTFAWQACLVQTVIHAPDNAIHEASPIDLFGFAVGVLLGVPIYAALSYALLLSWQKPSAGNNPS